MPATAGLNCAQRVLSSPTLQAQRKCVCDAVWHSFQWCCGWSSACTSQPRPAWRPARAKARWGVSNNQGLARPSDACAGMQCIWRIYSQPCNHTSREQAICRMPCAHAVPAVAQPGWPTSPQMASSAAMGTAIAMLRYTRKYHGMHRSCTAG